MKKTAYTITATIGLLLAGISAQAGMITSVDGIAFEGGAWTNPPGRQLMIGWTITDAGAGQLGADMRGVTDTIAFAPNGQTTFEMGNFDTGTRIGRDFFRNAGSSLDTNGTDFDDSYSWFTDGDTLDLSGPGAGSVDFTSGLTNGSNWFFITMDNAPTNYTGFTISLGGVSQVAVEVVWDDVDSSGTRSIGDTYDFGTILYATGGDTFDGGSWVGGAPTIIPEPSTYALLGGIAGLAFVALRRRRS